MQFSIYPRLVFNQVVLRRLFCGFVCIGRQNDVI